MNDSPIAKLRAQVEQQVPEKMRDAYGRVMLAGQKIMYSKETNGAVEQRIKGAGSPAEAAGSGAVELIGILAQNSRGTMPREVAGPAMMGLMAETLDYLQQTGRIKGDAADVDTATKALMDAMMKGAGVDQAGFDQILSKAQESMSNPEIAAKMKEAGYGPQVG